MPRYFAEIAYKGTDYSGWQIQPNALTVQEVIEKAFAQLFRYTISIVGCGRTDAGVHATQYYFHFDLEAEHADLDKLTYQLNAVLPEAIAVFNILAVGDEAHARFDAIKRSYVYRLHFGKNPFKKDASFGYHQGDLLDFGAMNEAAQLMLQFEDFFPFCKTKTEVHTFKCQMITSEWRMDSPTEWTYHVSANRFLRGMVRLLVGMSLNVGKGVLTLKEVNHCMEVQERLPHALSVPAEGLYLCEVKYPYDLSLNVEVRP